ncbi:amidohydrolase family protein [Luteitalea sp.]|uniref:amidohydrolase family protein n=1 Tax=Luteitalea sp. TaxID=2004800 RepID=UPI0037CB4207
MITCIPADALHRRRRTWRALPTCAVALSLAILAGCGATAPEFDLVVRGGWVLDGTGTPAMRADIGVQGDRIAALGDLATRTAAVSIDATGLVVAPGFIDTQGQSGRTLLEDGAGASHVLQGITSEIIGEANTPALWIAGSADLPFLSRLGIAFDWSGVDGFLSRLATRGITVNVGTLAPLNQLRVDVVGSSQRAARPEELEEMRRRLDSAMRQGAFGLSSALIYPPGSYASTDEIVALARTAAVHGGRYVSHIRGEGDRLETALDEAIAIAEQADIPVVVYHLKVATRTKWKSMPAIVARIAKARARGLDVSATAYPYPVAGTSLDASLPDWVHDGGDAAMLRRLAEPQTRARIRREITQGHDGWENFLRSAGFDGVTIADVRHGGDSSVVGLTLAEIARQRGTDPWDVFFDLLIEHEGHVAALYALMHEDDVREVLRQPWVSIGTDSAAQPADGPMAVGRPHPRGFGSFPRVLGRYVRDEQLVPLPEMIRRMTSGAAAQMGIAERGQVRPGWYADLVVFDSATVRDRATFDRPRQYPEGVRAVVVNGVVTVRDGRLTGQRAGRGLLGPGVVRATPPASLPAGATP